MSIRAQIQAHIAAGRLAQIEPVDPADPVERCMIVSMDIADLLDGPWPDEATERRANRLRADLEAFVKGDPISVSLTPYEHKTAYMGRLDKPEDEVWDVRSRDPRPGLRLFGRFAEVDLFIAFTWRPRSVRWRHRRPLDDKRSLEWELEILECQEQWGALFPDNAPIHGEKASDYVSENAFSV